MALLQVYAFGKLRLQCGQKAVDFFPTYRVEELLGYLLLNQQTHHSREKLIDVLWPDNVLANGRASFSTALWRLRRVFEEIGAPADAYVQATRDWVCFEPCRPFAFDLADFEGHLAQAEQAADPERRRQALRAAAAAYRGELCEGIYAEWCLLERERLERLYLRTLGQLMADCVQRRAYEEAVALGRDILRRDPLREEVHRAVMHCYWQMGRRAQAARQFQQCARLLQEELQILPMPETISLYRQIIEDRLVEVQACTPLSSLRGTELQSAITAFQAAADTLNAVLDAAGAN